MPKRKRTSDANTKKVWSTKRVLASSIAPTFPSSNPNTREKVLEIIRETFPNPIVIRQSRPSRKQLATQNVQNSPVKQSSKKPNRILCGVNEITRALEKRNVSLVIVCRDVNPALLIAHLPVLCFCSNALLVVMPGDGTDLGAVIGTNRLLAFGITKKSDKMIDDDDSHNQDLLIDRLLQKLTPLACQLDYPWLKVRTKDEQVPPFPTPLTIPHRKKKDMP